MTRDQKLADFRKLVRCGCEELCAVRVETADTSHRPAEHRRLAGARGAPEICAAYVASLKDGHSYFLLPSTFFPSLGFTVGIYEGKVLLDSIYRERLPAGTAMR